MLSLPGGNPRAALAVALICLFFAGSLRADGMYMPERAVPELPSIPIQQAVIVHRQGMETLVVESAFRSSSPSVAWILPLPAAPQKLEVGEPGMIASACASLRPRITHDLGNLWSLPLVLLVIIGLFAWTGVSSAAPKKRHSNFVNVFACVAISVLLAMLLLPTLGAARRGIATTGVGPSGLSILSMQRLGDYEVTVLTAKDADSLAKWLNEQGMKPFDPAGTSIVADYITRGWCFVVARLDHNGSDPVVPRPLMATFPAPSPVFPMRLTALAGGATRVELCVIADQEASAAGFHCVVADRFVAVPADPRYPYIALHYKARQVGVILGSPDVSALMWDGCVVTKLSADLPASAMTKDIDLSLGPVQSGRDWFFTYLSRRQLAVAGLLWALAAYLFFVGFVFRGRRRPGKWQWCLLAALPAALVVIEGLFFLLLPTIPVQTSPGSSVFMNMFRADRLRDAVMQMADKGLIPPHMTRAEAAAIPQVLLEHKEISIYYWDAREFAEYAKHLRLERSHGNYDVREIAGKQYICTYDVDGVETAYPLEPKTASAPATSPAAK